MAAIETVQIGQFMASAAIAAMAVTPVATQSVVSDGADGASNAVADSVVGILSFTRWPRAADPIRLCLTGQSPWTGRIEGRQLVAGQALTIARREPAAVAEEISGCDAVYLGRLPMADRRRLIAAAANQAVVTITDADPPCLSGTMFCLRMTEAGLVFDLNLDAVSRSRVRVDPRVLSMAAGARREVRP